MKIVFMGTPDFAVPSLEALIKEGHEILAVYTREDKPKGRGHKMQFTAVKECALEHGLNVIQPQNFKSEDTVNELKALSPDLIVVVAYGRLLPKSVLDIPPKGCINVHGSLLPKYRGAAPIQWAVLNGDKVSGVTTMLMAEGMDTGDMLLKSETEIGEMETSGELFDRLMHMGAELLVKTIDELDSITPIKQDETQATHAPMIKKEMSFIDFNNSAKSLRSIINGLNPWPSAVCEINGKKLKIHSAKVIDESGEAGKFYNNKGKLCVYCKEGALQLVEIQAEGKKRMSGESYLLGNTI